MMKPLAILASGTIGDILPYIALGTALQTQGQPVVIITHPEFAGIVTDSGIAFRSLGDSPTSLLTRPGQMPLTFNGNPLTSLRNSLQFMQRARPIYHAMLSQAYTASHDIGGLILGLPTLWGWSIAQALRLSAVICPLQPLSQTKTHPSALQPFNFSLGPLYNVLNHRLAEQILWGAWRSEINAWRIQELGLQPLSFLGPYEAWYRSELPFIYGISEQIYPRPTDWPPHHELTGFWFLPVPNDWEPPEELARFLDDGAPPVYVGFGSMSLPGNLVGEILKGIAHSGVRVILSLPGATISPAHLPPGVMTISKIPHAWLFKHIRGAVHHGGAGTTAASLRAGLPTAILPVGVDQFFWGERVWRTGVGPKPLPQRRITAANITDLLQQLVSDQSMQAEARAVGEKIRAEDGTALAAARIIAQL